MDKSDEAYYLNKYQYPEQQDQSNNDKKKGKKDKKDKKNDGLSKEEKMAQKELKKKQMQELCQKKNKKATSGLANVKKYIDKTKPGEKKDLSGELPEYYDPSYVESAWDDWWQKEQFFKVDLKEALKVPREKRFVMLLPPPNVTGSLHLGHALMTAIEDTITRYKRLKGFVPLWVPGVDHAGISTQNVVEKKLLKDEGKYRNQYTREDFVKRVWFRNCLYIIEFKKKRKNLCSCKCI